jgi:ADP-ribose pyrophosphatase YjhB (NUDIX family)
VGFIHYMNPRIIATVIVEHGGRVLLQQRAMAPGAGGWTFPGGFLEIGETPAEGAAREAKEEVGLDVTIGRLHGVYTRREVERVGGYEAERHRRRVCRRP